MAFFQFTVIHGFSKNHLSLCSERNQIFMILFLKYLSNSPFSGDFEIFRIDHSGKFDEWRVFGKEYDIYKDVLPTDTRLQRNFVEYIKNGGTLGGGDGIILFNGEKVLTRRPK